MRRFILFLGLWMLASTLLLTAFAAGNRLLFIGALMLWALIFFWVFVCGGLMFYFRNSFVRIYLRLRWPFWLKFTIFSTIFALTEEAIALSINNVFLNETGGMAILTASTDYWDLVSRHSVVVLIPIFFIFSFFIKSFNLSPNKAFIYFGIIGVIAEASIGGWLSLLQFGMWIFVYGLMVYLPAHQTVD